MRLAGQMQAWSRWRSHGLALLALFVASCVLLYGLFSAASRDTGIRMTIVSAEAGFAQWFFDSGNGYSEAESVKATYPRGRSDLWFAVPPGTYRSLRFDPSAGDGPITIVDLTLTGDIPGAGGVSPSLDSLVARKNVALASRTASGLQVVPTKGTNDVQLGLNPSVPLEMRGQGVSTASILQSAVPLALLLFLSLFVMRRCGVRMIVVSGLAASLALIVTMGALSPEGQPLHPDEGLHVANFQYYLSHVWPPAAHDPRIVPVLQSSVWGIAYLNSYDVVYFIAGHLMSPFEQMLGSPTAAGRAFQNVLWLALLLMAAFRRTWALPISAVLVTPQAWYVFSYFNGDAFPFFVSMCAVALACDHGRGVNRFLREGRMNPSMVAFCLCIGMLVVSKANYYPVAMTAFLWLSASHLRLRWVELVAVIVAVGALGAASMLGDWPLPGAPFLSDVLPWLGLACAAIAAASLLLRSRKDPSTRTTIIRFMVLAVLAIGFAAPRIVNDLWINGGPDAKAATLTQMTERYAAEKFKPSAIDAGEGHPGLRFAQKGISLPDMVFGQRQWLSTSLKSAFGTYGNMKIWAPEALYLLFLSSLGALLLVSSWVMVWRQGALAAKQVGIVLGTAFVVMLSAALFSWLYAFQAQGRYLLPIVPMLGFVIAMGMRAMPGVMKPLLVWMLVLSVLSFACIGLPGIAARVG
ncbi:hypothetical protein [Luteimonas saliphila]|uniref:hypothetical protein n=1 Tax=Luteimonas saliphila TaxID=2804919 RepID=UPI00192DCF54|nr:hypothetical protein [Luteimonas saliphila]